MSSLHMSCMSFCYINVQIQRAEYCRPEGIVMYVLMSQLLVSSRQHLSHSANDLLTSL